MNRKRMFIIAVVVGCLALLAAGTTAYFTAEETAYNVITMGRLEMTLHDEDGSGKPFPAEGIDNVVPDTVVDKVVYLENTGGVDFYGRIGLERIIEAAEGVDEELNFDCITLNINTTDWTEQDGYYYYNRALAPGEKSEPLFTTVTFEPEMGNAYMKSHVQINVIAQAVQSRNNGSEPTKAAGWLGSDR